MYYLTQNVGQVESTQHVRMLHGAKKTFEGTIYQPLRSGRIWHKVNF